MSMRGRKAGLAMVAAAGLCLVGAGLVLAQKPDKVSNDANVASDKKATGGEAVEQAALAAELALEGERRKSPVLILAAIELLGGVKESERTARDVKSETTSQTGQDDSKKKGPGELSIERLVGLAREYAKGDPALSKLVEDRLQQDRGLVFSQGEGLETVVIEGVSFKIIDSGVLAPGDELTLSNVIFEGASPAIVCVVGDGDGDLDLYVYDGNTGGLIGQDAGIESTCLVDWVTRYEGPFTIKVGNVGGVAEQYFVLANW